MLRLLFLVSSLACLPSLPDTRKKLPDGGYACEYVPAGTAGACCSGCGALDWCNTSVCRCEDVENPCGAVASDAGAGAGTPDAGAVPTGTVGAGGGTVDRLWFATTGDTRPGSCDATEQYPKAAMTQIAKAMKALRVQFAVDLGDHMYVCNQNDAEAVEQMGFYMTAIAEGPSTFWMTMGNHECGSYSCTVGGAHDANFSAYMAALKRPLPYYFNDVQTAQGKARFVLIADDSWNAAQKAWLESTLAEADTKAKYTIVARHHPVSGTRTGNPEILTILGKHKYTLLLTAHSHTYAHDPTQWNGRSVIVGLGGAAGNFQPGFGTVLQNADGTLTFVLRDANGNPLGAPWSVSPQ
jgi:hypothetical protein